MAEFDANRAAFVRNEYRYETRSDSSVQARYPGAVETVIDTQLDQTSAASLATAYFAEFSQPAAVYSTEIQRSFKLSDLAGAIPRYIIADADFPLLSGKAMRLVEMQTDPVLERTELKVRG